MEPSLCDNYVGWRNAGEHEGGCTSAALSDTGSLRTAKFSWTEPSTWFCIGSLN